MLMIILLLSILIPIAIIMISLCVAVIKSNELLDEKMLNEIKDI